MLRLAFDPTRASRRDLFLEVGGQRFACDTFFFMTDWLFDPAQEDPEKIRKAIVRCLAHWSSAVRGCADGKAVYLPYAFEERETGCIRCLARAGGRVLLEVGVSTRAGSALSPTEPGEFLRAAPGFRAVSPALETTREELLADIARSSEEIRAGRWEESL